MERAVLLFAALCLPLLAGCTPPIAQERDTNLPLLTGLHLDGQAQGNARVLLLSVDFRDADRDLSAGSFIPLINGMPSVQDPLELRPLFLRSGLDMNARAGHLELELEIRLPEDNPPRAGSTFDVGLVVTDGAGHESNRPKATLEISY